MFDVVTEYFDEEGDLCTIEHRVEESVLMKHLKDMKRETRGLIQFYVIPN